MKISDKLTTTTWAAGAVQSLRQELDQLQADGSLSIPEEPGGWWHQYVCPTHHTELLFNPADRDAPRAIACPHGCRIEGDVYRAAWLVFKHQSLARYALQAAAVYAGTKEQAYADLAKRILVSYAQQFPHYPVHPDAQPWMLKGRAFHQALTEAIWATTLLRAYALLLDEEIALTTEEQQAMDVFLTMLASGMTQYRQILIYDQNKPQSNYTAWLNAALSCVYAVSGQREQLELLIEDKAGWKDHLSIGVKPDQFEFEGSTYYHIFVLRAYLISAEMASRIGIDLYRTGGREGQSLEGMFDVLVGLADEHGVLPALHDGPLERLPFAREIAEIMEIGLTVFGKETYAPILGEAYRQMRQPVRTSLEALLYGSGNVKLDGGMPPRSSLLLADSGFVVGRQAANRLSFVADFGPHGGSHGHYDKLHISLQHGGGAFTPDLGVVPYGSPLRKGWFTETASHNTVTVGGKSQAAHQGSCVQHTVIEKAVYTWLRSEAAYERCLLERHLLMTDEWLLDWFEVSLAEEQTTDWWMHALRTPEAVGGQWVGCADEFAGYNEHGYDRIRLLGRYESAGGVKGADSPAFLQCSYALSGDANDKLYQTAVAFAGSSLFRIETPGTSVDPSIKLNGLLHRSTGRQSSFIHIYKLGQAAEVCWQAGAGAGTQDANQGQLIIGSAQSQAVCALDAQQGLIVTWRKNNE
jgi:hypothetical protein